MATKSEAALAQAITERAAQRELAHIRSVQEKTKADVERRNREAQQRDEQARTQEQAKLKSEVERFYLFQYTWATQKDFESEWTARKSELIAEYQALLGSVQPM